MARPGPSWALSPASVVLLQGSDHRGLGPSLPLLASAFPQVPDSNPLASCLPGLSSLVLSSRPSLSPVTVKEGARSDLGVMGDQAVLPLAPCS